MICASRFFAKTSVGISLSALALSIATPALADTSAAPSAAQTIPGATLVEDHGTPIIVTGRDDGYRTITTSSGTKTDTAILDVPQAIAVVTADQINDQAIRSMADLVRLVPGVSAGQGEGHRDQVTIRGNNSTADFFIDGLRDDAQYFRSFYNLDRVEIHRGPNAMVFGRGGGGGIINRVTKSPLIDQQIIGATLSADTFGAFYGAVDLNLPVGAAGGGAGGGAGSDNGAGIRLNGFYEELNNHRDGYDGSRYAVNPVIGATLGGTTLQLGYEYVHDDRNVDRGVPAARAGTTTSPTGPLRGFRDTSFGRQDTNRSGIDAHIITARTSTDLTSNLRLTTQALYGDYDKIYTNIFASGPVSTVNTLPIQAYRDTTKRQSLIAQGNLIWTGNLGGVDHVLLVGAEYTTQDTVSERINGFFGAGAPTAANRTATVTLARTPVIPAALFVRGPTGNGNRVSDGTLEQVSAYVQDQLSLGDAVDVVAGLRYDRIDIGVTNVFTGVTASRVDDLWSPRAGLIVHPVPDASVYISYARSYLPQSGDQFVTLDATSATLEPEQFDNYEIGAKWDIIPSLTATAAVYRLDRTNTRAAGPTAGTVVQTGAQRSSGAEVALTGQITGWWSSALGFAYTRARITDTTAAAPAGRNVAQVPRYQVSLWNRFDVTPQFGFGLGLYHQSAQFTTISNVVRLPGYTRLDAAVYYTLAEGIEAQINIENVTDAGYFPNAHNDNNISTGAPINARFTLTTRF